MKRTALLGVAALCLLSAIAGAGAYRWWLTRTTPDAAPAAQADIRPDLEVRDLNGQAHKLSEWNGKLLLVNFWATWCAPCLKEIPLLIEAQKQDGPRGLQIVGIALDETAPVQQLAEHVKINYPIMIGQMEITSAMDALGDQLGALPFSVLIGPDGRILDRTTGGLSQEELANWLSHLPS